MNLDAYFERIGYVGPRDATLATLNAIILAHIQSIPFENLDVLLGRSISLEPAALFQKLVVDGRGGYCFEQNGFFLLVLEALGFQVKPLSARVRLQRPREFTPPRTHLFVRVELEGESWLADVGVGGLSPTSALRLEHDGPQATPHEPRRIVRENGTLFHQAQMANEWHDVCEFTLEEMPLIDREVANWYTSTHPLSRFKSRLLVARATANGRITLQNQELTFRNVDGTSETRVLASQDEILSALAEHFTLQLPRSTRFHCVGLSECS